MNLNRVLAIDLGEKRIGLAISDALGITAQGLETVMHANKKATLEALSAVCKEYAVSKVVIGLPVNMDGSFGPKAKEVLAWVPLLEEKLGISVKTWDERLTSRQADRLMIEQGLSRRRQKEKSDQLAATLILQSYLESGRKDI